MKPILNATLLLLIISVLIPFAAFAVEISTSVDRNPVNMDESFKILFDASDTPDSDPDFSPLDRDFTVLNQGQSSSSSWINGTYSKSIRWTVEVAAKKTGKLTVPAIKFGNNSSKPLVIDVAQGDGANDTANTNQELFLEVKATPEEPFVQSQVLYTVKLYRRVEIAQASLSEPELADAVIEKLAEDSNYNTMVNGVSYAVTERKYAIFAQKSGQLKIKPLALNAQVIVGNPMDFRDFFGSRMSKTKRVLSKEITLNVKPAPASFTGKNWLAAEKLELSQEWSGDSQQMKIGEPLTRTLTLRGEGVTVGQLPELNTVKTDASIKAYPDQPVLNEQKLLEGIHASRQEKIALIPSTSGKHVLPAIEIPWFNTKTQTTEIARLPEMTINVLGASSNPPQTEAPPKTTLAPAAQQTGLQPNLGIQTPINTGNAGDTTAWQKNPWLWASVFLALGWLATAIYFLRKQTRQAVSEDIKADFLGQEANLNESVKKLKEACADNDAQSAKNALLAWGKQKFAANNLGAIAEHCDARLRDEILALNQVLYSKDSAQWTGKKLSQAFTENKAREKIASKDVVVLEPLHRL